MVLRARENSIAAWAFLVGVILAIIVGLSTTVLPIPVFISYAPQIYSVLALLGIFIGFVNVSSKDTMTFMLAGAVLVVVARFGMDSVTGSLIGIGLGKSVSSIFAALLALFVPATIVVALKTVFSIAKV